MRILVNYDKHESNYLPILQYYLRQHKLEAIATPLALNIGELIDKAKVAKCEAILLCNSETLKNCAPGDNPTLDAYRGSRFNFSVPTVVCNSLAHVNTIDHGSWLLEQDIKKLLRLKESSPEFGFDVLDTTWKFQGALSILSECVVIAYDIETITVNENEDPEVLKAGDTLITCCSWSGLHPTKGIVNYVLPIISFMQEHWTTDVDYAQAIGLMQAVNKLDIPKVMHNGMYDCTHSIVYHAEPHYWIFDTMAMQHSEFASLPKTLDFVASIKVPDYFQWKEEAAAASKSKDIQRYWAYNARDTYYTLLILLAYLKELPAYARKNYAIQFKLVYPFLYCNFEGFKIDNAKRKELIAAREIQLEKALTSLRTTLADPNFNPGSPNQVKTYIYDVLGAKDPGIGWKKDPKTKRKTKIVKGTDEKNLKAVSEQHPILLRVVDAILSYREAKKAISTYFLFLQKNERLLYNVNPFGTETGRASAQASSFWCGTQVQNIPPYAKPMLCADEGYELAEPDNSQSEARCVAYLAEDTALIAALEDPIRDFYKTLGTLFFSIPYEEVTTEFRNDVLKKIVHGTNYMMGAATFVENAGAQNLIKAAPALDIKISLAKPTPEGSMSLVGFGGLLLDSYHKPFNKVKPWYDKVKTEIATTHKLVSPLGWTRYFFGDINKKYQIFASAVAHGPQNLSVSILNIGIWKIWQLVKQEKGAIRLKAQIHDSAPFQYLISRPDLRDKAISLLDNSVVIHGRTLRIPVDYKAGPNWGAMKKYKREG